jgi:hypothetical protein
LKRFNKQTLMAVMSAVAVFCRGGGGQFGVYLLDVSAEGAKIPQRRIGF